MGLKLFSSSSYDNPTVVERIVEVFKPLPNPNPKNFRIIKSRQSKGYLIVMIRYPDCKNYEGNKILVFKDLTLTELRNLKSIDPHFSNNKKYHSPIARFEPTDRGWEMAIKLTTIK